MSCPNPSHQGTFFSVHILEFFREGGGLPISKIFEEIFCLSLEIFQEGVGDYLIPNLLKKFLACIWTFFKKGGVGNYLISKMLRNLFLLWLRNFSINTLSPISRYKIGFIQISPKIKEGGGGNQGPLDKIQTKTLFLRDGFPKTV